jgi:hypothetical protein
MIAHTTTVPNGCQKSGRCFAGSPLSDGDRDHLSFNENIEPVFFFYPFRFLPMKKHRSLVKCSTVPLPEKALDDLICSKTKNAFEPDRIKK